MKLLDTLWWLGYTLVGICIQLVLPGMDALAPGLLIALQEGRNWTFARLAVIFLLIQEGAGSMHFGAGILWYAGFAVIFTCSARLFVADNLLFVAGLSAGLGAWRAAVQLFMCAVQDIPVDHGLLLQESLLQALLIPVIWTLALRLRPKRLRHVH